MKSEYEGKHVAVTGATGGLGRAVVTALLENGAVCHLPLFETAEPADWDAYRGAHVSLGVELGDESAVQSFYQSLPPLWASIHLVGGFAMSPVADTTLADFNRMHRLNAQTCFLCCREAVLAMRKREGGGRIVNVTARPVLQPVGGMLAYTASKAAVAAITRALAAELEPENILVNAIVPSIIDTPANRAAMPEADFGFRPKPSQIAENILFLASPQNSLSSGSLVPVYGRS